MRTILTNLENQDEIGRILLSDTKLPKDIPQYFLIANISGDAAKLVHGGAHFFGEEFCAEVGVYGVQHPSEIFIGLEEGLLMSGTADKGTLVL